MAEAIGNGATVLGFGFNLIPHPYAKGAMVGFGAVGTGCYLFSSTTETDPSKIILRTKE